MASKTSKPDSAASEAFPKAHQATDHADVGVVDRLAIDGHGALPGSRGALGISNLRSARTRHSDARRRLTRIAVSVGEVVMKRDTAP
jgi:hypothetical protein